jgi:hypothetical protein
MRAIVSRLLRRQVTPQDGQDNFPSKQLFVLGTPSEDPTALV